MKYLKTEYIVCLYSRGRCVTSNRLKAAMGVFAIKPLLF